MTADISNSSCCTVRTELLRILQGVLRDDISSLELNDDLPIASQVTMDSMDFLDFVIEIRKHLRVDIPEEKYAELSTIREFIDYVNNNLDTTIPAS